MLRASLQSVHSRWLTAAGPSKGFERFFPKGSKLNKPTNKSTRKKASNNSKTNNNSEDPKFESNNGNKNNKKKKNKNNKKDDKSPFPNVDPTRFVLPAGMTAYVLYSLLSDSSPATNPNQFPNTPQGVAAYRRSRGLPAAGNVIPIDFHTFATQLLPTGHVKNVVVTSPNPANVILSAQQNSAGGAAVGAGAIGGLGNMGKSDEILATVVMKDGFVPSFLTEPITPVTHGFGNVNGFGGNSSEPEETNISFGSSDVMSGEAESQGKQKRVLEGKGIMEILTSSPEKIKELKRELELEKQRRQGAMGSAASTTNGGPTTYVFTIGSIDSFERSLHHHQTVANTPLNAWVPVTYATAPPIADNRDESGSLIKDVFKSVAPSLLLGAAFYFTLRLMMGGKGGPMGGGGGGGGMGGLFQMSKSKAKKINPETIDVTFKDVAGCELAKKEVMEFVQFLSEPEAFTKVGAKVPKGALLSGPPGTGKTLLAKAVAGEANVPFYSISGSDFIEMFVGVGPSRVRDLFSTARADAPCIIFIDEIDAVGRQRGKGGGFNGGGNDERENTLNQLLVEMDGFEDSNGVVVLAGTNRPDILDKALLRPGRFDRSITVDKPDIRGRKEIFKVHLSNIVVEGGEEGIDEICGRLAGLTPGFAGADIANMCNEAAINAGRRKADSVTLPDFEEAVDRVLGGLASPKLLSEKEKRIVAYHEAGHAICGWFLEHADPVVKVTIVPRGSGALGYAQYLPKEVSLRTREEMLDIVCMALGGRAAEQVFFGKVTNGASNDLQKVTGIVYELIRSYGMGDTEGGIGQLSYPLTEQGFGTNQSGTVSYSNETAFMMDQEAKKIVDQAYARTIALVEERREEIEKVAELLIEKETISHDDVLELVGERGFEGEADQSYQEYVHSKNTWGAGKEIEEEEGRDDTGNKEEDGDFGRLNPVLSERI